MGIGIVPVGQTNRELHTKNMLKKHTQLRASKRERERERETDTERVKWRDGEQQQQQKISFDFLLGNETKRERAPSSSSQQI